MTEPIANSLRRRLLTSAIGIPASVAVVFYMPGVAALAVFLLLFLVAAGEFIDLVRPMAPSAPLRVLFVLIPLAAAAGLLALRHEGPGADLGLQVIAAASLLVTLAGCAPVLSRTAVAESAATMGILAFAVPYFALPPLLLYWLKEIDPWLVMVLLLMVWIGDTAAWAVGKAVGRRLLAPVVSPRKTWEGAAASLTAAVLVMAAWSLLRLGEVTPGLLAVAALASVAAQLGDLAESALKRGAGVKDSADTLPGHGGFYDRLDALFFATPVFAIGLWALGLGSLTPGP